MKYIAILFVALFAFALADFNNGGSTCDFGTEACTPVTGSAGMTFTGGVNVDSSNVCAAGTADTRGTTFSFEATAGGFWTFGVTGYGDFSGSDSVAVLIFSGDADGDNGCNAWLAFTAGWTGYVPAGTYTVAVLANNGADAEACGEFVVTGTMSTYDQVATTDTEIQAIFDPAGFCLNQGSRYVAALEFTPEDTEGTHWYTLGQAYIDGVTESLFVSPVLVMATADVPTDLAVLNTSDWLCNNSALAVALETSPVGYQLTVGTAYTFFVAISNIGGEYLNGEVHASLIRTAPDLPTVEVVCDNIPDAQNDYLRPDVPALRTTDECVAGTDDYVFDVRHLTFDTDVFFVSDTITSGSCSSAGDMAVVLYYGEQGTPIDGANAAVAPDSCENFILAGDSGDGGAVYYWFPANEVITVVPTKYGGASSGGDYFFVGAGSDIVGCIPENPYLVVETSGVSSVVAFVAFVVIAALF